MTKVSRRPVSMTDGSWKSRLFPPPVGMIVKTSSPARIAPSGASCCGRKLITPSFSRPTRRRRSGQSWPARTFSRSCRPAAGKAYSSNSRLSWTPGGEMCIRDRQCPMKSSNQLTKRYNLLFIVRRYSRPVRKFKTVFLLLTFQAFI